MLSGFTMDNSLSIIHGWFHDILLIGVTRSQAYLKKLETDHSFQDQQPVSVSYTHLTLPTNREV